MKWLAVRLFVKSAPHVSLQSELNKIADSICSLIPRPATFSVRVRVRVRVREVVGPGIFSHVSDYRYRKVVERPYLGVSGPSNQLGPAHIFSVPVSVILSITLRSYLDFTCFK